MTLNSETGEKEWQLAYEKQVFEHNDEMYKIETIDSDGKRGELVVSPEHRVYALNKEDSDNFLEICFVDIAKPI